jgi:hypothetical protein
MLECIYPKVLLVEEYGVGTINNKKKEDEL